MIESLLEVRSDDPVDDREAVAREFVAAASCDPTGVPEELLDRLAQHFGPQEVMEIVMLVGFWKMYNTTHSATRAPLEDPVLPYGHWVDIGAGDRSM